ncbi:hypothetical protein M8C21_027629 [Ambrosia artemisiifolia]|uniref:Two-component response regulator n=1 Tax=Ambrosia artemisiifolia TaxID=4212 RepID=A0AAD5CRA9_AMBAR|nr:hypothetical protein M8C21_027629 [Ambrosia artemisiifolia]
MMPSSSGGCGVSDQFPAVTKCNRAEVALSYLRENKNGFDVVISDVHMPDMDGFKLLEHIGLEMDLPVIMMSADDSKSVVMKGVTHGACDYLIKPVRIEALRNIWQHVVRKRKHEWKDFEPSASADEHKPPEEPDYSSSANEGNNWKNTKRRKDDEDEAEERDDSSSLKKPRVVWSVELHQQFVAAVNQLGIDKAVPKKILELMNVPGLTRENVASHLQTFLPHNCKNLVQKYRLYLRRLSGSPHPGGMNTGFMGGPDAGYGSMSSLNGLDLQALAASGQLGQLPPQSLATLQAVALGRSNNSKSAISVPVIDQRNIFSFENPKSRYSDMGGQSQTQSQTQSQLQVHSNTNAHHGLRQPVLSNNMLTRGGSVDMTSTVYSPVVSVSQASSLVDFSMNHKTESFGSSYHRGGSLGIPNVRATSSALQGNGNGNLDTKASVKGIVPSYDVFNDLSQNREWGLQDSGLTFDQPPHSIQVGSDGSSSLLLQHNRSSSSGMGGQNRNLASDKVIFAQGVDSDTRAHHNGSNVGQQRNTYIKTESHNDGRYHNTLYSEQYGQDDLLAAILKQQQQEGAGQPENEFGFDAYALDDLPV